MSKNSQNLRSELLVLERHFLDEVRFKIESLLGMYNVQRAKKKEILSFVHELQRLTDENIEVISTYVVKR